MKNKLLKERLKWGAVAAMGLGLSMISSGEKINKQLPEQTDQSLEKELERSSLMQHEAYCFLSSPNVQKRPFRRSPSTGKGVTFTEISKNTAAPAQIDGSIQQITLTLAQTDGYRR